MRKGPFEAMFGRGGVSEPPPADDAPAFLAGALPDEWFTGPVEVSTDRDEIIIFGRIPEPELAAAEGEDGPGEAERAAAEAGRIARFRESTRDERIGVAQQLEHRYRRKVGWAVACGGTEQIFTNLSAPVMTRLRQRERKVLDTLVDSGVARSRADALAWCVRLVGQHAESWLGELREAMAGVEELRRRGPNL